VLDLQDPLANLRRQLRLLAHESEDGEVEADSGLTYGSGEAVRIRIRRRGRRYDLSDDGEAVARAGKPAGWRDLVEQLVAVESFNVNRRGVLLVPAVEGRDIAALAMRLAQLSRSVYLAVLELRD
jgi:hypothetical protein